MVPRCISATGLCSSPTFVQSGEEEAERRFIDKTQEDCIKYELPKPL